MLLCFVQTSEHLSALFMTVVDWQSQFFCSLLGCYAIFQPYSTENVGSQLNFSHIFTYCNNLVKWNISQNFFPVVQNL